MVSGGRVSGMGDGKCASRAELSGIWTCRLWSVIIPVALLCSLPSCSATPEADALLRLASSWGRLFPTWMGSDPCIQWEGVTCFAGKVVGLNLSASGLTGPISPAIGQLTSLTRLDLSSNAITSPIPSELALLQNLQVLNFYRNPLNAPFSMEILQLKDLVELRYDVAGITGRIPEDISNLKKLEILFLGNNSFVGPLPATSLGSLTNLKQLTLWGSQFKSPLPPEFGNLVNLQYLNMHSSTFWGGLPPAWSNMKNITRMLIYNNDLTGYVPDSWKALTTLRELHVGQNTLSGPFPEWIVNIPIEKLEMSRNSFQSPIPEFSMTMPLVNATRTNISLYCNYFNGSYPEFQLGGLVNITGNCFANVSTRETDDTRNICNRQFFCRDFYMRLEEGCAPCPAGNYIYDDLSICTCKPADYVDPHGGGSNGFAYGAVIGGVLGSLAMLVLLVVLCKWDPIHKRLPFDPFSLFTSNDDDDEWDVPEGVHKFTMAQLSKATGNFDKQHEIGEGGSGKVFYGTLADGKMVAIKRVSMRDNQSQNEFRNEVNLLSRLHHRHLVRLEGFCEEQSLQILVYEHMKNGNLGEQIARGKEGKVLEWYKRLEIAVGIAQGLDYLHSFADPPVIHRDVKPSNILLDEHMVAKVGDFGISKATPELDTHVSTRPAGTVGYLDPEYFLRRHLTTASDVYGYGVLLLEMITGQRSIDLLREERNLIEWVQGIFHQRGIEAVVDVALDGNYDKEVFTDMTNVALMCASYNKNDRPTMKDVVSNLEPHVRAFQRSGTSSEAAHSRSLVQGSNFERLMPSGRNPDESSRSIQFMTMPLRRADMDYSPFITRRPDTMP